MTFSSWPNPDKLSVLLKEEPFYYQEKGGKKKDEQAFDREGELKKLKIQWHPFAHSRGNFRSITGSG